MSLFWHESPRNLHFYETMQKKDVVEDIPLCTKTLYNRGEDTRALVRDMTANGNTQPSILLVGGGLSSIVEYGFPNTFTAPRMCAVLEEAAHDGYIINFQLDVVDVNPKVISHLQQSSAYQFDKLLYSELIRSPEFNSFLREARVTEPKELLDSPDDKVSIPYPEVFLRGREDGRISLYNINALQLDDLPLQYDVIDLTLFLYHLRPADQLTVIQKASDKLNPGGYLLIDDSTNNPGYPVFDGQVKFPHNNPVMGLLSDQIVGQMGLKIDIRRSHEQTIKSIGTTQDKLIVLQKS